MGGSLFFLQEVWREKGLRLTARCSLGFSLSSDWAVLGWSNILLLLCLKCEK